MTIKRDVGCFRLVARATRASTVKFTHACLRWSVNCFRAGSALGGLYFAQRIPKLGRLPMKR